MTLQKFGDYLPEAEGKSHISLRASIDFFFLHTCSTGMEQKVAQKIKGIPSGGNSMTKILVD